MPGFSKAVDNLVAYANGAKTSQGDLLLLVALAALLVLALVGLLCVWRRSLKWSRNASDRQALISAAEAAQVEMETVAPPGSRRTRATKGQGRSGRACGGGRDGRGGDDGDGDGGATASARAVANPSPPPNPSLHAHPPTLRGIIRHPEEEDSRSTDQVEAGLGSSISRPKSKKRPHSRHCHWDERTAEHSSESRPRAVLD